MSPALLLTVRLHEGRYHGESEWPPSPARLFQALVAGAGLRGPIGEDDAEALSWLEGIDAPVIGAPQARRGQRAIYYMPNNDLDLVGGDVRRLAQVRTAKKVIQPFLFEAAVPFLYAWTIPDSQEATRRAKAICGLAESLYQLGRGVDMAWSYGELLDVEALEAGLQSFQGRLYRPSRGGRGVALSCPHRGSLDSLFERQRANRRRFRSERHGKSRKQMFFQAPKPDFAEIAYDSPPARFLFELRSRSAEAPFAPWPLAGASKLVSWARDRVKSRLLEHLPGQASEIERCLIGRKADGSDDGPSSARIRIIPLPSVGHAHSDAGIRRLLVEVPSSCLLRADGVRWAFSGEELAHPETGELSGVLLEPATDEEMLAHYGVAGRRARTWRTITPAALPEAARRRRIDPSRMAEEAKGGAERALERSRAAAAVAQALRHVGIRARVETLGARREPFEGHGERAEAFATDRFPKERLWHVEISFSEPVEGPLVIGDGRFLGLGIMRPVGGSLGAHVFDVVDGLSASPEPGQMARALRRAVMARVQSVLGVGTTLPSYFTGHGDGDSRTDHRHLSFAFDPSGRRLLVFAPHILEHRPAMREEAKHLDLLDAALLGFRELRTGADGLLALNAQPIDVASDPLFAPSRTWETATAYQVTRHHKLDNPAQAVTVDVLSECRRRGLPTPRVAVRNPRGAPDVGLTSQVSLEFNVAVAGPLILGRSRHFGGGLFTHKVGS
ncbi:MAG: type I-G CRISPR-associated protein Csb2 [Myxococcales bacterium]